MPDSTSTLDLTPAGDAVAGSAGTRAAGVMARAAASDATSAAGVAHSPIPRGANVDRTATVAVGLADTVIKATSGRLRRVFVTAAGSGGRAVFYDNASTHSGVVIGAVPADAAKGEIYTFNVPAALGIVCRNAATGPAITVSYD